MSMARWERADDAQKHHAAYQPDQWQTTPALFPFTEEKNTSNGKEDGRNNTCQWRYEKMFRNYIRIKQGNNSAHCSARQQFLIH